MISSLIKRLYEERLYNLLPINSSHKTYEDVEKDKSYLSYRSIILNVALSRDLNVIIEQTVNVIDKILNDEPNIASENITDEMIHSILVLIRLLNGILEYYWNQIDDFVKKNKYDSHYLISMDSNIGSTKPMKPIKLKKYPKLINDSLVLRLLDTCIKIKFHIRTLNILANISNHLSHGASSVSFNTILPDYQRVLKDNEIYKLAGIMDFNVCQISRFLSASNPNCFFHYIYDHIQKKFLLSQNELSVVPYLHFLGQVFLVKSIAFQYLEFSRYLLKLLNKPLWQYIIMFYVSKVYIFWIVSRPEEYVSLIKEYKVFLGTHEHKNHPLHTFINNFSDEIYSKYNISSILTNTQNVSSNSSNKINPDIVTDDNDNTKIHYFPHLVPNIFNSSTNYSNLFASNFTDDFENIQSNSNNISNPSFISTEVLSTVNVNKNVENMNCAHLQSSLSGQFNNNTKKYDKLNYCSPPVEVLKKREHNFEKLSDLCHTIDINRKVSKSHKRIPPQCIAHLSGVLLLFSYFDDNDSLTHIAPLKFLMILALFDTEVFHLMNNHSFKYLLNPDLVINKQVNYFDDTIPNLDNGSLNELFEENSGSVDKQRKRLSHGLKKLSLLSFTRRRSFKFLSLLIKNLNESSSISETVVLDSLRVTLMYFLLASSVSMVDKNSEVVILAKRMLPVLGINLGIGDNWGKTISSNKTLTAWLSKNQLNFNQLKVKYIISVLRFEPTYFMKNLNLSRLSSTTDLEKLDIYIESIKLFYSLPARQDFMETVANQTSSFLKDSLCAVFNTILKDYPSLDEKVTYFVDSIIDGTIIEQLGNMKSFSNSDTPSIASSVQDDSSFRDINSSLSQQRQSLINDNGNTDWTSQVSTPLRSSSSNICYMSSSSMVRSKSNNNFGKLLNRNENNGEFYSVVAPQLSASKSSKKHASLLTSSEYENSNSHSTTSHLMSKASSIVSSLKQSRLHEHTFRKDVVESDDNSSRKSHSRVSLNTDFRSIITDKGDIKHAKNILFSIFTIFDKYLPSFILPYNDSTNPIWVLNDFRNVIKPIFVSIILFNQQIQTMSESVMNSLVYSMEAVMHKASSAAIKGYILISNYTICLFSMGLFDLDIDDIKRKILIRILIKNLKLRNHLIDLAKDSDIFDRIRDTEKVSFPLLIGTLGRGVLLSLSSSDSDVHNGLRMICQVFDTALTFHIKYIDEMNPDLIGNLSFQKMLGQCDDFTSNTGSVFFQRKIRKGLLKNVKSLDSIILDSVYVLFKKWKSYARIGENLDDDEWIEFRNLSGILAPLSGLLFLGYRELGSLDNSHYEELVITLRGDFNFFIYKQCQWLNDSNLIVRENARDVLGIELNPLSYKILFAHLSSRIEELFSSHVILSTNEESFILLEQIIITLRTILQKEDEEKVMILFSVDILSIIEKLLTTVSMIPRDSSQYYKAIIQLSKMFKALENSEADMALKNHFRVKNNWLRHLTEWFKLAISKEYDIENLSKPHREMDLVKRDLDHLYIDTVIESSKAIAYLTKNLPLEIIATSTKDEMRRSMSVKFGNYFNILLKGLKKTMEYETYPLSLRHKMSIVNENVIWSLTNLSRANIESSWKFTLPMGYSSDKNIRIAFLKLFINIVSSMQVQKTQIEKEKLEAVDNFLQFTIENPQLSYAIVDTCPSKDLDAYATVLVDGLKARNAAHIMVCQLITKEIECASRPMDILRRNSCATRVLSIFSKYKGSKYLIDVLQPVLKEYVDSKEYFDVEKLQPSDRNYDQQIGLFVKYMRMIIDAVTQSLKQFPPEFFYICHTIYTEVKKKFPDYAYIAVGSFVFLRFICPALVNPEAENIIEISSICEGRPLVTLAKAIQTLANGSENMIKWPSLTSQSEFLSECSVKIFKFLKEVCAPERISPIKIRKDGPSEPFEYSFLHYLLVTHGIAVRKRLLEGLKSTDDFSFFRKTFFLIDDLFGKLGEPKVVLSQEIPEFFRSNSEKYPKLYEYMNRQTFRRHCNMNKALSAIRESITSNGIPVISLNVSRGAMQGIDRDTLIYQFLKVYVRIWNTSHFLAVDFTEFDNAYFDIRKIINLLNTLLPSFSVDNCRGFYLLNINENFMHCWDMFFRHENIFLKETVPVYFINSATDGLLMESLHIESSCFEVWQDIRVTLHDVELIDLKKGISVPVSLKIGNKYFQILFENEKTMVIKPSNKNVSIKVNEVRELVNISSVHVSSKTASNTEFTIRINDGETFVFSSSKFLEIVKIFHHAIAREEASMLNGSNTLTQFRHDVINNDYNSNTEYNDIICNLILVMVVSLFHPDNAVKSLSYNLFGEADKTFHLGFNTVFHKTPEIYVPYNVTSFLYMLAKAQAHNKPSLTSSMWKYSLKAIKNDDISKDYIPTMLYALSKWVQNLMDYVYFADKEEGPNTISRIFRDLIKVTVKDTDLTTIYLREIWFPICADGRLSDILVNEAINHALERDSENRPWNNIISIICSFPTVEISREIVKRLLKFISSFLPSLQMEASNQSWAELKILVSIAAYSFFESPFLTKMFLPEILFIISLLIDVGSTDMRLLVHKLLMNLCSSLAIDDSISNAQKEKLELLSSKFSKHRIRYISGFSQHKGSLQLTLNVSPFSSKFNILRDFVQDILEIMQVYPPEDHIEWMVRFQKLLNDMIFSNSLFLSSRAAMINGIILKKQPSENFCRALIRETTKVVSLPITTDENMFTIMSHCFTFTVIVDGLDPLSYLIERLFWLSFLLINTYDAAVYEGALVLMSKTLIKLSESRQHDTRTHLTSVDILLDSRKFASNIFDQIDEINNTVWNKDNFPHILVSIISSGYLISSIRHVSVDCLKKIFMDLFLEEKQHNISTNYQCYMFILFLFVDNEEFLSILKKVEYNGEVILLSKDFKIPVNLLCWLASDSKSSNISLYQGSLIFNSKSTDEQARFKFALIMRYLLAVNPVCLFRFYGNIEERMKKIIVIDNVSELVPLLLDVIGQAVKYKDFDKIVQYQMDSLERIEKQGLGIVTHLCNQVIRNKEVGIENIDKWITRRKLFVRVLERLICT